MELYNFTSLVFLAFYGWRWSEPSRPPATPGYRVDVFVATYNEPREVVEPTLAGCAALRYPHETYLLDDGRRPEMEVLAAEWGARYITRPDNSHAKAGNVNHALGCTSGELIFCLDADHVPLPDALDAIVGYFDDENVALVQSPHDFYNQDSVQHYEVGRHEQSMFFEVVCPGKDRHNGVYWCGSAAILRRVALVGVGGVATETIAEDFHTSIKMHQAGWRTRYHDEILVQGLAPLDIDGYLLQRDRWARGNLAVFRLRESPLRPLSDLSLRQRFSYFGSLFAYGAGASRLAMIWLLVAVLGAGVLPARMTMLSLAVLWAPWTILAVTTATALCRGHLRTGESSHYTLITAAIFTRALRCALLPSKTKFKVTPKAGAGTGGLHSVLRLKLLDVSAIALAGGLVWRGLAILGYVHRAGASGVGSDFRDDPWNLGAISDPAVTADRVPQTPASRAGPLQLPRLCSHQRRYERALLGASRRCLGVGRRAVGRRRDQIWDAPSSRVRLARARRRDPSGRGHGCRAVRAPRSIGRVADRHVHRGDERPFEGEPCALLLCRASL